MDNEKIIYFQLKDNLDTKAILLLQQFAAECQSDIHVCCNEKMENVRNLTGMLTFCLTAPSEKQLRVKLTDSSTCDHIKIKSFLEKNGLGKLLNKQSPVTENPVVV